MGTGTGSKLIDIDGVQGVGQEFQNQMRRKTWCSIGNGLILAAPKGLEVNLQFKSRKREHRGAWRGAGSSQLGALRGGREETLPWPGPSPNSPVYAAVHFIREA
jgi:hypothetical protein